MVVRMGILGAAGITKTALVTPAASVDEVELCAVAARDQGRAEAFAREHNIGVVYPTYQALLEDGSLDAVYVPLANSLHAQWSIAALTAGTAAKPNVSPQPITPLSVVTR